MTSSGWRERQGEQRVELRRREGEREATPEQTCSMRAAERNMREKKGGGEGKKRGKEEAEESLSDWRTID